jgi:integrase
MTLYGPAGTRKYLTAAERQRFLAALSKVPPKVRLFCLVLMWSGGRISEALALTPKAIDLEVGIVSLETLKRRERGILRQVPLPPPVLRELTRVFGLCVGQGHSTHGDRRLWPWSRATGWRRVKEVMTIADIQGTPASPKGLRHTFGVAAFQENVPPHLVQRWLGHASLRTTAIYGDVMGAEERAFAARMWHDSQQYS